MRIVLGVVWDHNGHKVDLVVRHASLLLSGMASAAFWQCRKKKLLVPGLRMVLLLLGGDLEVSAIDPTGVVSCQHLQSCSVKVRISEGVVNTTCGVERFAFHGGRELENYPVCVCVW